MDEKGWKVSYGRMRRREDKGKKSGQERRRKGREVKTERI